MTRQDFILKWLFYALALLPVWWMDTFVLGRFPVLGVAPMLLPVAAVAVAVLEGALAGAGFGLAVGVLCDAVYFGGHGFLTLGLCLIGWGAGAAAGLVLIDTVRVFTGLFTGLAPLPALLRVALPEVLWSLCFACLLYPWFTWVRRRIIHFLRL